MCIEIHDKYKHGVKNSIHVYQSLQVQGWMEHVNLWQSCLLQKRMHYHVFFCLWPDQGKSATIQDMLQESSKQLQCCGIRAAQT